MDTWPISCHFCLVYKPKDALKDHEPKGGLPTFRVYTLISAILTKSGLTNGEAVLKISIEKVAGPRALQSGTGPVFFPSKNLIILHTFQQP